MCWTAQATLTWEDSKCIYFTMHGETLSHWSVGSATFNSTEKHLRQLWGQPGRPVLAPSAVIMYHFFFNLQSFQSYRKATRKHEECLCVSLRDPTAALRRPETQEPAHNCTLNVVVRLFTAPQCGTIDFSILLGVPCPRWEASYFVGCHSV